MENDDKPVGQILSRRDALKLLGVGSAAFLAVSIVANQSNTAVAASSTLACVVRPELTIGPYFVDDQLNRSDIRSDPLEGNVSEGIPLTLKITVFDVASNSCTPLKGAQVDIWHCDAFGIYSGVSERGFNTVGQQFLRGYQLTDATGKVQFKTIYPGWYSGRAVHIHFMIRTTGADGKSYEFVSQFFFSDTLTDRVHAQKPYASKGRRNTRNASDNIFNNGGDQLLLALSGDNTNGYASAITIGLDLTDAEVGASDTFGQPGGGSPS